MLNTSNCLAQVEIGAYAGISTFHLSGERPAYSIYKPGPGLAAGAIINIGLSEDVQISLQPGISLSTAKLQTADTLKFLVFKKIEYRDSVNFKMDFAQLPILIRVISDNRRFHFTAGCNLMYILNSSADNGVETIQLFVHHKDFNVAAEFGIGFIFPIYTSSLSFDLKYNQSLLNWSDNQNDDSLIPRIKSSGFNITLAWTIPVSKKERPKL